MAWILLVATLANRGAAQESRPLARHDSLGLRGRAFGEVRDAQGKAWPGAEVVFVSRPIPNDPDIGDEDRVVTTSDGAGRLRAELLCGRPYSAWAWGEATAEGRRATRVAERVFVQQPMLLTEARRLQRGTVQIQRGERWPVFAPFELRVIDLTGNRQVTWHRVDAEGRVQLPFLVGDRVTIEVHGASPGRYPILMRTVALPAAATLPIELPECAAVTCWVRDSGSGAACAGATLFGKLGESMFAAGVTDKDGKAILHTAKTPDQAATPRWMVVSQDHRVGICAPVFGGIDTKAAVPKDAGPDDLWSNLLAGERIHVRVQGLGGPMTGVSAWCAGSAFHRPSRSSSMFGRWQRAVTADAHGVLVIDGFAPREDPLVHLVLREAEFSALPPPWRRGLIPVVFAPLHGRRGAGTATDPFVVELTTLCPVEMQVAEARGAPAAHAELGLITLDGKGWGPWGTDDASADAQGRLRVLVPGRAELGVRALAGNALVIRAFETGTGRTDAPPAVLGLMLPTPATIQGQLLTRGGEPATDRTVHASFGTDNRPAAWDYPSQDRGVLERTSGNAARVFLPEGERQRLMLTSLISRQFLADAEGRFVVPLPPVAIPELLLFAGSVGTQAFSMSLRVDWTGESVADVAWTMQ